MVRGNPISATVDWIIALQIFNSSGNVIWPFVNAKRETVENNEMGFKEISSRPPDNAAVQGGRAENMQY